MKEEEDEVDIDSAMEPAIFGNGQSDSMEVDDTDFAWADRDKADVGQFKMKIVMQEDSEL